MRSKQAAAALEGLEGLDVPRLLAVACRALERVAAEVSGDTDLGCDSALIGQGLSQAADRAVDGLGAQVLDGAVGDDALTSRCRRSTVWSAGFTLHVATSRLVAA